MDALDGPLPVLGAKMPINSDFLDAIRGHKCSAVFEVAKDNRDCLLLSFVKLLQI